MPNKPAQVAAGVLLLCTLAAVALVANFFELTFGQLWQGLVVGLGVSVMFWGFLELGLGLIGVFGLWLLANLGVLPEFGKSWPFALVWIAVMVVVGFLRARGSAPGKAVS
jgi:hypothetical protein